MSLIAIVGIIILVVIVLFVTSYNKLVVLKNNVDNSFADIDVQMKMRFDLVENLVNTVKGYTTHEKETLQKVTESRTQFMGASSHQEKLEADNMLTGTLKTLFAVSEQYPDLKANQNFIQLQTELSDIENKIAATRRYFNSSIKEYNVGLESFPSNIIAGAFNFKKEKEYFATTSAEEKIAPKVQF